MNFETFLLEKNLVSADNLAIAKQKSEHSVVDYLIEQRLISDKTLAELLSAILKTPIRDLSTTNLSELPTELLPLDMMKRLQVLPLSKKIDVVEIAISDPQKQSIIDAVRFYLACKIKPVLTYHSQLKKLIQQLSWQQKMTHFTQLKTTPLPNETSTQENDPLSEFINEILEDAIIKQATDIHFEPYENFCRIRFRIDSLLVDVSHPPLEIANRLASRLKIMAKLDIAEKRLPQDGRLNFNQIDIRINSCPTIYGEKIVLRLLDTQKRILTLEEIGLIPQQQALFLNAVERPQGLILVTGPTGSGKTITLYAALRHLNTVDKNICSVEDPVEINLPGINQVNTGKKAGLDFSKALRAFLRQDPDVIMIGEIRDQETAKIALRAAQTGHLVLASLHTNSATETLTRLTQMGIAPSEIANSLSLVTAQRLLRKICIYCHGKSCDHCAMGYHGRIATHELMPVSRELAECIVKQKSNLEVLKLAIKQGMTSLSENATALACAGMTSSKEVKRVLGNSISTFNLKCQKP